MGHKTWQSSKRWFLHSIERKRERENDQAMVFPSLTKGGREREEEKRVKHSPTVATVSLSMDEKERERVRETDCMREQKEKFNHTFDRFFVLRICMQKRNIFFSRFSNKKIRCG